MTTTEGGMVTTKHEDLYTTVLRQRGFGVDRTASERHIPGVYDVKLLGFNYRMSEVEAAIGIEQLKKVPRFLKTREENYQFLEKGLKQIDEISLFQSTHGDFKSSYYCLSILLNGALANKRFELVKFLNEKGIGTSIYYPQAVPNFTYYKEKYGYKAGMFPVAEKISGTSVALPVAPHLNLDHMSIILNAIKEGITKVKGL